MNRITLSTALFAALIGTASPARAAGPADQGAGAALFAEAKTLASAGDYEHACPKFEEAQRLFPTPGTLLNLGNCFEKLGRLASAWGAFKQCEVMSRNQGDHDREQEASRRAQALAPQLPKLAIVVPPTARVTGFELRRDGTIVGEGQWGMPLPADEGHHTIEASAPGYRTWSTVVRLEPSSTASSVEIPPLEKLPVEAAVAPPFWGAQRIAGATLAGAGLVALVTSAVFTAKMATKNAESKAYCMPDNPNLCSAPGHDLRAQAFDASHVATGTVIAGGVVAAAGVVILVTAPRGRPSKPDVTAVRVTAVPLFGTGVGGFTLQGVW